MRLSRSLVLLAALATTLSPGAPARATAETCRGLPATMVGSPGTHIFGTAGADVIITNGAASVDAGFGDDVVCTTGSLDSPLKGDPGVAVFAGPGDDVVDSATDNDVRTFIDLGDGTDSFFGGDQPDTVSLGPDAADDSVAPGHGDDVVFLRDRRGRDSVSPGRGDDTVWLNGRVHPDTFIGDAEVGLDVDTLVAYGDRTGGWVFDNGTGEARRAGVRQFGWSGIERFDLSYAGAHTTTRFLGSPADDTVVLARHLAGARMGEGDDRVVVVRPSPAVPGTSLHGGSGRDELTIGSDSLSPLREAHIDLRAHLLSALHLNRGIQLGLSGFERHTGAARSLTIIGTAEADDLHWAGCKVWVRGGGGDDRIGWSPANDISLDRCPAQNRRAEVHGDAGDDVLTGSRYADTLDGGAGRDVARAGQGRDRCAAEVRRSCELRMVP